MKLKQLRELRKKILFLTIITSMSYGLNGCNRKDKDNQKQYNSIKTTEITVDTHIYHSDEELITTENIELTEFLKYSNQIIPTYKNEELYLSESEINNIINKAYNNKTCDYVYDNDIDDILSKIKANSIVYLARNKEFSSAYEEFEIKYKIDFNEILKEVLQSIISESTNNINEDICNLKTLKVVITYDEPVDVLAYYDRNENIIAINIDALEREKNIAINHDFLTILKKTLRHELNHLRQYPCECRQTKGQLDESLKYDDYYNSILMESSAESEIYNISEEYKKNISKNNYTYYNQRKDESLIILLGLFNENKTLTDYYNAIFDSDLKALYDYAGADTKEEIYELYKIIYSIDALNLRNDLGEYLLDKNDNDISQGELQNSVGYGYKVEIFKKVLENMAIYTTDNNDFTLEENIVMLNIIKNSITINSYVIEESKDINDLSSYKYIYEDTFVEDVYNLENNYVEFLSNHYNCEIDTIREIEYNSIVKILTNINYISQGLEPAYYNYKDIANSVYEKFPIIKAIAYSNSSIQYGYSNFLKNNNLTLVKKYE